MMRSRKCISLPGNFLIACYFLVSITQCTDREANKHRFELLSAEQTGLTFSNQLEQKKEINVMNYMYFFNGGGVGAGDFNNDGKTDLFFSGNLNDSKLFLNTGNLTFKDVSAKAGVNGKLGWSTGVSVVDINNDGMLDIYVCRVSNFLDLRGRNELFVCKAIENGIPVYEEMADQYQLGFEGFNTQASFFDYDLDGDLDCFLLRHSVHENGTFGERSSFLGKSHPLSGDKLLRNDDGKFVDVSDRAGILSMVVGYGLGVATGDVNNDGWPDIYVSNDFHENDYLYMNQRDGSFKEVLQEMTQHTSRFSMGVDVADFNNDGNADIFSLDMQPYDPVILKSSLGEDEYSAFDFKLKYGYSVQFARNNLQLNNGDSSFSEIAMLAGVYASDWSWAPLFVDFDLDGYKDLFVANGIPARMNDIDYVNFRLGDEDHRWKTQANRMEDEDLEIIRHIPEIKIPNRFFQNNGNLMFSNINAAILNDRPSYSNGATYGDFDGDGDMDIVVNNINDAAYFYKNLAVENNDSGNSWFKVKMKGPPFNARAIGARVITFRKNEVLVYENYPVRGFQSSVETELTIGVGNKTAVDSTIIIWPDLTFEKFEPQYNVINHREWREGLPKFDFANLRKNKATMVKDITKKSQLDYRHEENSFIEFDRERLIPFMVSTEGPAVAVGDFDGDGRDDVFLGSSKRKKSALYFQKHGGMFAKETVELFREDSVYEDVNACVADVENDGDLDLIVAAGGNEFWEQSDFLKQRIYLNDGRGNFSNRVFFPDIYVNSSIIIPLDFNDDGLIDFFIGGRSTPQTYGVAPTSFLMQNLGDARFKDVTAQWLKGGKLGMIKGGKAADMNGDGQQDLVLAVEWEAVKLLLNNGERLVVKPLTDDTGLWNNVELVDYDSDGDLDVIAGNAGLNTKFNSSSPAKMILYVDDFDDNGQVDQILTHFIDGREIPFATHAELTKQLPSLKKKFLLAKDFAKADLNDMFGFTKLAKAKKLMVSTLESAVFENKGNDIFTMRALPLPLQFSSIRTNIALSSGAGDGTNVFFGGNFHENNVQMGWYDADFGNIYAVSKSGEWTSASGNPLKIHGQIRHAVPIVVDGNKCLLVVRNNDTAKIYQIL